MLIYIFRILIGVTGMLFVYAALFIYEDELGKIQSTLEDMWVKIDDRQRSAISWHMALMREVAAFTGAGLDRIFGEKLFSLRSFGVSLCCSYASYLLMFIYYKNPSSYEGPNTFASICVIYYLILGTLSAFIKRRWVLKLWFAMIFVSLMIDDLIEFMLLMELSLGETVRAMFSESRFFYLGLIIGISSDIFLIALLRKVLRWNADFKSLNKLIVVTLLVSFFIFAFFIGPMWYEETISKSLAGDADGLFTFWVAVMSNLFIASIAMIFVVLALIMLVHRIFWPVLNRLLYALQRIGIARRSKLFGTVGVMLIAAAWSWNLAWLEKIVEKLSPF